MIDVVIKKGYLTKLPPAGVGKTKKRRYFVLYSDRLEYYVDPQSVLSKGDASLQKQRYFCIQRQSLTCSVHRVRNTFFERNYVYVWSNISFKLSCLITNIIHVVFVAVLLTFGSCE